MYWVFVCACMCVRIHACLRCKSLHHEKNLRGLQTVKRSLSYSNGSWAELISKLQIIGSRVYVILHPPCQDGLVEYREEKATKKQRNKGNKPRFLPLWLAARRQRGSCMDVESCSNLVAETGTAITIKTVARRIPPPQSVLQLLPAVVSISIHTNITQ